MSNTLTLTASGSGGCTPDQDPWTPTHGAAVSIVNNSGSNQTLSSISNGCLLQTNGGTVTQITISGSSNDNTWNGKAGSAGVRGTYTYNDGSDNLDMRSGTIDPS